MAHLHNDVIFIYKAKKFTFKHLKLKGLTFFSRIFFLNLN